MLQNDFLMRAIQRLAQAFGEFIAGKAAENPQASLLEIENLLAESLNTRRQFLFDELASKSEIEPRLAVEYGRLLALYANLAVQCGDEELAALGSKQAARFLQLGLGKQWSESSKEAELRLVELVRSEAGQFITEAGVVALLKELFRFAVETDRSAKAEDYLFMVLDRGEDLAFRDKGIAAFSALRARIVEGDLPPENEDALSLVEIDAALNELSGN